MDKSLEKAFRGALHGLLEDIIREVSGEETLDELHVMSDLQAEMDECLREPKPISLETVDRYNQLCRKHFIKLEE